MEHCAPYLSSCRRFVLGALCPFPWIAGDAGLHVSAPMPGRVLGRSGTAIRYRGSWPAWLDASCCRSWSWVSVGQHVDSAMPCCYLVAWRDVDRGQPAWIAANHWAIVRAGIERRSSAQGGHRQAHDSGGVPRQDLRVCRGTPLANNFIFFCYTRA